MEPTQQMSGGGGGGGPCKTPAASLDPCLCTDPALPVLKSVMGWGSPAASPFTSADLGTGMTCPDQSRLLCTGSDEKVPRWGRISKYKAPLRWRQGARDPCAQRLSGTFRWRRRGRWTSEGGALPGGWSQDGPQVSGQADTLTAPGAERRAQTSRFTVGRCSVPGSGVTLESQKL